MFLMAVEARSGRSVLSRNVSQRLLVASGNVKGRSLVLKGFAPVTLGSPEVAA
jgi:hypothetical protein